MYHLEKSLLEDIKNLNLSKKYELNAIDVITLIQKKSFQKNRDLFSFIELSQKYLVIRYSKRFNEWLNKLIEAKILISNNSYEIGKYCKSYCINNKYININNSNIIVVSTFLNKQLKIKELSYTKKYISSLKLDYKSLKEIIDFNVGNLSLNDFRLNEQIKENVFEVTIKDFNFEHKYYTTKEQAVIKAKELGKDLIQDKNRFLIINAEEFIKLKKNAYYTTYNSSLDNIYNGSYYINRNTTNNRLDSVITNMCGILIDKICLDNKLVQIDLKNSQFAILSYVIPTELYLYDDVKNFIEQSQNGTLYEYIQKELLLDNRKQAKQITFEVLFSSQNNKSNNMKFFKELFPNLLKWINDYKKTNGYESFSIMLQKMESTIFIDGIYTDLIKRKIWCLTKHDSIICKDKDYNSVKTIMENYFNKINFKGVLV
jgi:hypothetical protein